MPGFAATVSDHKVWVQNFARKLSNQLSAVKSRIPPASKHFELKGDLIIFRNTDALAKDLHAFLEAGSRLVGEVIPELRKAADDVQRFGRSITVNLISRGALGLSATDPSLAQLVEVLFCLGAADAVGTRTEELSNLLRRGADALEKKAKAPRRTTLRLDIWAAFKGNAFNWRKRRFEVQGLHPLCSLFNSKANPKLAALEASLTRKIPSFSTRYYTEFLLKQLLNLGMALGTAALVSAVLGQLWEELTLQHL